MELIILSASELGLHGSATFAEIYDRVQKRGYDICPAEVGPQLCLQHSNQTQSQWLLIGMEPLIGSLGMPEIFFVGRREDGQQWLYSVPCCLNSTWDCHYRWIFRYC